MPHRQQLPSVAVSAPGKVLLAGGYLVLDRRYTGLVFGLSARINVVAAAIQTSQGVQVSEVVVDSPQFIEAQWRYGYHLAPDGGGIKVTQLQVGPKMRPNAFVETTLSYALSYVAARSPAKTISAARLVVLADNDYYSQSTPAGGAPGDGRFASFSVPLSAANKTGLGSSAALVTALAASLLAHYLPPSVFDVATAAGKQTLHNLAQAAHCAAQGKVGSGFDVAAAVYGSCTYRRFSPSVLAGLPEPGAPGFCDQLVGVVDGAAWDAEVLSEGLRMPPGVALRMCDVDCGSQTVGMVNKVLAWRAEQPVAAAALWDELQRRNEALAAALRDADAAAAADAAWAARVAGAVAAVREHVREMGRLSGVPIEPAAQTELLDAVAAVEGVYGGVVPGAGGFDALALLMRDDDATTRRVEARLAAWGEARGGRVRLLGVRGETEGVRVEDAVAYRAWLEAREARS